MESDSQSKLLATSTNTVILNELQELLKGQEVIWVQDAKEALRLVEEGGIGLALIDCEIEEAELWKRIKEKNDKTSVILFGGDLSSEELIQAYRNGVYDYVPKARLSTDLKKSVERIEERRWMGIKEETLKKKLKESEKKYRGIIEHANDAIFTLAANGILTFVNRKMEDLTGRSKEELVGERLSGFIPSEKREDFQRSFQRIWTNRSSEEIEAEILDKEGKGVTLAINNTLIVVDEELVGIQCIARDITQRKESEERFRKIVETTEEGIVTFDGEGRFTSLNKAAERVLGCRSNQLLGESLQQIVPHKEREVAQSHLRDLSTGTDIRISNLTISTAEGEERRVEFHTKPLEKEGSVIGAISVVNQIREGEPRGTAWEIFDSMENPILALNERGEITMVNQALLGKTGYTASELEGRPISILIDQEEQEPNGGTRLSLKTKEGGSLTILALSFPLKGRLRGRIIIEEKVIN